MRSRASDQLRKKRIKAHKSRFVHAITSCEKSQKPVEVGGGIVADEMGLGKTLTMLSAIIQTADEAKVFGSSAYQGVHSGKEHSLIPSRAKFVVVPSPRKYYRPF
jgi:SWI/SNF-related matrix-associated actin-dependent regulator of chromatin subfamily A3